jgi:TRAP-type C4-dicarboxylate transport system permease small subunit
MKLEREHSGIFDTIIDTLGAVSGTLIVLTMAAVLCQIIARYFFNRSIFWIVEVIEWGLVWMTFLAAPYVLKEGRHVSMDLVVLRVSPKTRAVLGIVTSIFGALICLTMTYYGIRSVWDHVVRGVVEAKVLKAPKAPLMAIIPFGFSLLFLQFIRQARAFMRERRTASRAGQ